jgi:glycosyl-4,4'-diaponeurosporenoate acyltransferase
MTAIWILNLLGWPLIHVMVSLIALRRPLAGFSAESFLYRARGWENQGQFYQDWTRIRSWKRKLPDGAAWLGFDFKKSSHVPRSQAYLDRFVLETCRGEWCHWLTLSLTPIFFLWNPLWACMIMLAYGLLLNIPCIVTQRYNRIQVTRLVRKIRKQSHA